MEMEWNALMQSTVWCTLGQAALLEKELSVVWNTRWLQSILVIWSCRREMYYWDIVTVYLWRRWSEDKTRRVWKGSVLGHLRPIDVSGKPVKISSTQKHGLKEGFFRCFPQLDSLIWQKILIYSKELALLWYIKWSISTTGKGDLIFYKKVLQKPHLSALDQMMGQSELKLELIYRRVSRMWRDLLRRRSPSLTCNKLRTKKGCCIFPATKEKKLATCEYHQQKTLPFRHWALSVFLAL